MAYVQRGVPVPPWKAHSYNTRTRPSTPRSRAPQRATYLITTFLLILLFWLTHRKLAPGGSSSVRDESLGASSPSYFSSSQHRLPPQTDLPCRHLPDAEDVLVVLKTGATEFEDKLPIHLNTTLRCYPHYIIFSDYEETYQGEHIYDALEFVSPDIQATHEDFELWRRLRDGGGRSALKRIERSGPISRPQGATGKTSNPGWKLDKWKFLPMLNRTLHEYPDMKWYVFVETDTYILWQTLLNYLSALDASQPIYMGGQIWIGDIEFAHGGTGFAVSRRALELQVSDFQDRQEEWEDFVNYHWAGDCVLGKAMKDAGVSLMHAWPTWQADDIGDMKYAREDNGMRVWCMPTVSYHHLSPQVVEDMWKWEQKWIAEKNNPKAILHHYDMYYEYVLPQIQQPKLNWDNHAEDDRGPVACLEECHEICVEEVDCVQYVLSADLRCLTTSKPNLGEWSRGVDSGWLPERMKEFYEDARVCKKNGWILPSASSTFLD